MNKRHGKQPEHLRELSFDKQVYDLEGIRERIRFAIASSGNVTSFGKVLVVSKR